MRLATLENRNLLGEAYDQDSLLNGIILLVDDNTFNLLVAQNLLVANGYRVRTAMNGQESIDMAIKCWQEGIKLDYILMDLQMPIMDGYEATEKLIKLMNEKKLPGVPIIAISANDGDEIRKRCIKVGMEDYLTKPLIENDLKKILGKKIR